MARQKKGAADGAKATPHTDPATDSPLERLVQATEDQRQRDHAERQPAWEAQQRQQQRDSRIQHAIDATADYHAFRQRGQWPDLQLTEVRWPDLWLEVEREHGDYLRERRAALPPQDDIEAVAAEFLDAVINRDRAALERIGTEFQTRAGTDIKCRLNAVLHALLLPQPPAAVPVPAVAEWEAVKPLWPFGLVLDELRHQVHRGEQTAAFGSRLQPWFVLLALLNTYPNVCTRERLETAWPQGQRPSRETIRQNVSDVRSKLKPLGVNVKGQRGIGYELTECDPAPAAPARR